MELQDRRRDVGSPRREESFRRRTGEGYHRAHRAPRRPDQRHMRTRFRAGTRSGQGSGCGIVARREEAAARRADDGEGILQCRRPADDMGLRAAEELHRAGGCAVDCPRQGGRRRHSRQDQCAGRAVGLAELQRHLRHHQQSVRPRPHAGRLLRRLVGGLGGRLRRTVARRIIAASTRTSRRSISARCAATRRRRSRRCRSSAISR